MACLRDSNDLSPTTFAVLCTLDDTRQVQNLNLSAVVDNLTGYCSELFTESVLVDRTQQGRDRQTVVNSYAAAVQGFSMRQSSTVGLQRRTFRVRPRQFAHESALSYRRKANEAPAPTSATRLYSTVVWKILGPSKLVVNKNQRIRESEAST